MQGHRQLAALGTAWVIALGVGAAAQTPAAPLDPSPDTPRISLDDFRRLHAAGQVLTVDVRDASTFARGHIPHAISVPLDQIEAHAIDLEARANHRPIVTYCSCPNDHASAQAAAALTARGVHDVRALAGGLPAWVAAGGSLLRGRLNKESSKGLF